MAFVSCHGSKLRNFLTKWETKIILEEKIVVVVVLLFRGTAFLETHPSALFEYVCRLMLKI